MAKVPRSRVDGGSLRGNLNVLTRAVLLCVSLAGLLVSIDSLLKFHARACGGSVDGLWGTLDRIGVFDHVRPVRTEALCPQVEQLLPERNKVLWDAVGERFGTDAFKEKAIDWLSGAVRVPTESYDKMEPVGVDPRWTKFQAFHDYLLKAFPLVHSSLKLTKVNTYGLVYEWVGSDPSLKPLLLACPPSVKDVVPVDPRTVDEWVHPPFSGFYDGKRIWGRGSSDDKSGLIGVMSAIETLLGADFQPTRKIVLAFGFDEEVSGLYGAKELGKYLEATYGEDTFAMIVDEGGGFSEQYGGVFAVPAVGEKGYIDTRLEVLSPGGHSSVPPVHTSIGILSALLVEYETHPIPAVLDRTTPIYGMLQCFAAHAPDMDSKLSKTVKKSVSSDKALHELEKFIEKDKTLRAFVGTTQAIDLIQGGVKTNALPEQAWAVVNHRIATQSSVAATKEHDTKLLAKLAKKFNLTYDAFGQNLHTGSSGSLTLTDAFGTALEPAPITPTDEAPYKLLSGTIRATYNSHRNYQNAEEVQIAPGLMTGNTDTRYYWNLTKHIFRYNHNNMFKSDGIPGGIHTVNESIAVEGFLEMIRFFATLILNVDEYDI
ncbi:carboxypeptidase S [Phellopilus nigrolimitatus]|nr:carboxypeptidase S [Phellopilus nigrolimitatus]